MRPFTLRADVAITLGGLVAGGWTYSGRVFEGSLDYVGSNGRYWSSTSNDSNNAYNLNFNSDGNLNPSNNNNRRNGFPVRCVARLLIMAYI